MPRRRSRRPGEGGVTLVDAIVAIAIMTLSIVIIAGGFASSTKDAAIASDQARLSSAMQNLSDWVRSDSIDYQYCPVAPATTLKDTYTNEIKANLPTNFNTAYVVTVTKAVHADAGSAQVAKAGGGTVTEGALTTSPCSDGSNDWGIQQLQVSITSSTGRTMTQTLYKSAGTGAPVAGGGGGTGGGTGGQLVSWTCNSTPPSGEPYIFYTGGQPAKNGVTPTCAVIVPPGCTQSNCVVQSGVPQTFGAEYNDEKNINSTAPCSASHPGCPTFSVDGTSYPVTLTYKNKQWVYDITVSISLAPGNHTAVVTAWDTDQNKAGGDFGVVTFNFTSH